MNPYLKAKRAQYDAIRSTIEGLQTRAASEDRDLTEDELRSVTDQAAAAKTLADEIESLTDIEIRNNKIAGLAGSVDVETRTSATQARDRDPGHYRADSNHSFFGDLHRAKSGDEDAARRLTEHNRALTTGAAGSGIVPPKWLTTEYAALARQGRSLANAVRNIPLGDDPRPMALPKQVAGAGVAEQAAENDALLGTDAYDTDVDNVVPKATAGFQIVSRQMLDMSNPAVDQLIYADLLADYNTKVEAKVGAAIIAAAGTAVTTFATEAAFATDQDAHDAVVDTAMGVWAARKLPADILAMSVRRWGAFKKLRDTTGRPLIPAGTGGPMNVIGVGSVQAAGQIEELGVIPTDGIALSAYPESVVALRASDTILFESNLMRFQYEQPLGPESIKLGVWGYTAVLVRYPASSVKRFVITAAA